MAAGTSNRVIATRMGEDVPNALSGPMLCWFENNGATPPGFTRNTIPTTNAGGDSVRIADIDVIESNEAFAAQALGVSQQLDLDPAKVNPNGGAVALGHPIGATGCILTIKAMYELQRTNKRYGLVTMCIGGGQGIAAIIERL